MRTTTYRFSLSAMGDCCRIGYENSLDKLSHLTITSKHISETSNRELTITVTDDGLEELAILKQRVQEQICTHYDEIGLDCVAKEDIIKTPFSYRSFFQSHWFLGALGLIAGLGLMILCMYTALPMMAMIPVALGSIGLTIVLGKNSFQRAKIEFMEGRFNMDSLFFVSTLTAMIASIAACFAPGCPMMFDAGLMIFGFRHLGEGIKQSLEQTMGLSESFQDRAPKLVKKRITGGYVETALNDIVIGDELLIEDDVIPVNGICLSKHCVIDESFITGEPTSRKTVLNELLFAGTKLKNGSAPLSMRVTAIAAESMLVERDHELNQALSKKAPLHIAANEILQYFVPGVFILAAASALLVGYFYTPALAVTCAVNVLVSACPCTLSMITALAIRTGMKKAEDAKYGIQFKNAEEFQNASRVRKIIFDFNGTLTVGKPQVTKLQLLDHTLTEQQLLKDFASIEAHSATSVGEAIRAYAYSKGLYPECELPKETIDDTTGVGLKTIINDKTYLVGNSEMMRLHGIVVDEQFEPDEGRVIYLAREQKILGFVVVHAPIREDAPETIACLKALGIEVFGCTGDTKKSARHIASQVGIEFDHVYYDCRDKKRVIESLGADITAMVGDAGNDAVAVARSCFGIAIQSRGHDKVTRDKAGAVIRGQRLAPIVTGIEVAKQTVANIKQNLIFSLGYNLIAIAIASGLLLSIGISMSPGMGAALMIIQSSLVLWNMYQLKRQPLSYEREKSASWSESFGQILSNLPKVVFGAYQENKPQEECANRVEPDFLRKKISPSISFQEGKDDDFSAFIPR